MTDSATIRNLTLQGREFTYQGPTPRYGTFLLHGPKGATFLATQAYTSRPDVLKVIGGRGVPSDLYIRGNRAMVQRVGDDLVEWDGR